MLSSPAEDAQVNGWKPLGDNGFRRLSSDASEEKPPSLDHFRAALCMMDAVYLIFR